MNDETGGQRTNAIVMVIDRLSSGHLGPYGNTWIDTPSFNRLAAESLLFEFAMTDSTQLPIVYRSYWQGTHAMAGQRPAESLAQVLKQTPIHTALITDDSTVAALPGSEFFDERISVVSPARDEAAVDIGQTHLARLFAKALQWLEQAPKPYLLWIHSQGMDGLWDAPLGYRNQFAEEDDPLPPEILQPPRQKLSAGHDPDVVLGIAHAYAGQVSLLDDCLGVFLESARTMGLEEDTMLTFTSPRGYPLGEHQRVGPCDDALYGESVHMPSLLRYPLGEFAAQRSHLFVQPTTIHTAILQWLGMSDAPLPFFQQPADQHRLFDRACAVAGGHRSIRTPAWYMHRLPDATCELFAKPDDRWEANEISDRCHRAVEELNRVLDEFEQATQAGSDHALSPLPRLLIDGVE